VAAAEAAECGSTTVPGWTVVAAGMGKSIRRGFVVDAIGPFRT